MHAEASILPNELDGHEAATGCENSFILLAFFELLHKAIELLRRQARHVLVLIEKHRRHCGRVRKATRTGCGASC